jgi:hypothetical protein
MRVVKPIRRFIQSMTSFSLPKSPDASSKSARTAWRPQADICAGKYLTILPYFCVFKKQFLHIRACKLGLTKIGKCD